MTLEMEDWDGLVDERGPIPAFGPARTDERGRVVITDEEWEARRDASIRALKALGEITNETDTDPVWDEVFRGLERDRRVARSGLAFLTVMTAGGQRC